MRLKLALMFSMLVSLQSAWGGAAPLVPIETLGRQAALVVEATVAAVLPGTTEQAPGTVQLTVERSLKGQPPSTTLFAAAPPETMMPQGHLPWGLPPAPGASWPVGQHGIWFLASSASGSGYDVLTRVQNLYTVSEMYLPVSEPDTQPPTGTLDAQLLAYVVRWYQALPSPGPSFPDDAHLMIGYAGFPPVRRSIRA